MIDSFTGPDPYTYLAVWGLQLASRDAFDLMVARQMLWIPYAAPSVRRLLLADDNQPVCPACEQIVASGTPSIICVAVLADRALQELLTKDPREIAARDPDCYEAWWLLHGDCFDALTPQRVRELDERLELALRASTRDN